MKTLRHLIVGGGMTGHAAAAAIREQDPDAQITMLSADPDGPYARPPLSKGLWLGKPESSIQLPEVADLRLLAGRRAVALDAQRLEVRDDQGAVHRCDRLLLATGGTPRRLAFGGDRVIYFRTLGDYRRLRAEGGRHVVVIGGGFIGTEVAAALAQNGTVVTLVFPEATLCARAFPADLSAAVTETFEQRGVDLRPGATVVAIEEVGSHLEVRTGAGEVLRADAVVAGLGIRPDTALAEEAGLRCGDGIEVDAWLRTSAVAVYAAGDVARFPCHALSSRVRVEHEDAALTMGRTAGLNMAGLAEAYDHLPFFYSDLFDLGYEAVGRLDARMETVATWTSPFREGAVYYLEHERVRGVLLWGIFGQVEAARRLVRGEAPLRRDALDEVLHG